MTASPAREKKPKGPQKASPWDDLDESGSILTVDDFITTMFSLTSNGLRRAITLPYADAFELSVAEWRVLSVLAQAGTLPFAELVTKAAADKAQVSRSVRLLQQRGWASLEEEGAPPRKKLTCHITAKGRALYRKVMPVAQRSQARMILELSPEERRTLYHALKKLRRLCAVEGESGTESGAE